MKAFPQVNVLVDKDTVVESDKVNGMDLRDYFAAKAMLGNISNGTIFEAVCKQSPNIEDGAKRLAEMSYLYADAMMEARKK